MCFLAGLSSSSFLAPAACSTYLLIRRQWVLCSPFSSCCYAYQDVLVQVHPKGPMNLQGSVLAGTNTAWGPAVCEVKPSQTTLYFFSVAETDLLFWLQNLSRVSEFKLLCHFLQNCTLRRSGPLGNGWLMCLPLKWSCSTLERSRESVSFTKQTRFCFVQAMFY